MDDDTTELITLLCTRVGAIMEDSCFIALTTGSLAPDKRSEALGNLKRSAGTISRLIEAAQALQD